MSEAQLPIDSSEALNVNRGVLRIFFQVARLGKAGHHVGDLERQRAGLRFFAAALDRLGVAKIENLLRIILRPIFRITQQEASTPEKKEIKTLATEVQEFLRHGVAPQKFAAAFQRVREDALKLRQKRKRGRSLQKVLEPEAAAKRRQKQNANKVAKRKVKQQKYQLSAVRVKRSKIKPV
eukprot:c18658_g2_i1.p1 GENE.c18658_g2_i1~~c18658_g2_i1.p1  ORF type:complete len:211 (+),score=50.58 c18658_g2_i1:95-634(+)